MQSYVHFECNYFYASKRPCKIVFIKRVVIISMLCLLLSLLYVKYQLYYVFIKISSSYPFWLGVDPYSFIFLTCDIVQVIETGCMHVVYTGIQPLYTKDLNWANGLKVRAVDFGAHSSSATIGQEFKGEADPNFRKLVRLKLDLTNPIT